MKLYERIFTYVWNAVKLVALLALSILAGAIGLSLFHKKPTATEKKIDKLKEKIKDSIEDDRNWLVAHPSGTIKGKEYSD